MITFALMVIIQDLRPTDPGARDEVAALRTANARLREVTEAKDTEIGLLRAQLEALTAQVAGYRAHRWPGPSAAR